MNERDELHDIRVELIRLREVLSDINSKLDRLKLLHEKPEDVQNDGIEEDDSSKDVPIDDISNEDDAESEKRLQSILDFMKAMNKNPNTKLTIESTDWKKRI